MPTIPNPTPEQRKLIAEANEYIRQVEAGEIEMEPVPRSLQEKIDDQVETSWALRPGTRAREVYDEVFGEDGEEGENPRGDRPRLRG